MANRAWADWLYYPPAGRNRKGSVLNKFSFWGELAPHRDFLPVLSAVVGRSFFAEAVPPFAGNGPLPPPAARGAARILFVRCAFCGIAPFKLSAWRRRAKGCWPEITVHGDLIRSGFPCPRAKPGPGYSIPSLIQFGPFAIQGLATRARDHSSLWS